MMQQEYTRYSCQLSLPDFGAAAQQKLHSGKVILIGLGGLGCPVAQYLVASGVGTIALVDYDSISQSNLHRQVLYAQEDVDKKKVEIATAKLSSQNPLVNIISYDLKVDHENILGLIRDFDVVIDATDNFDTHYLINDACVLSGKPLVFGAIYQYEGQVAVWNVRNEKGTFSPNYRDIFSSANTLQIPDCTDGGVLPTIAGIIGCMQANEVIKLLTGHGSLLSGRLLVFDAKTMDSYFIKLKPETQTNITGLIPQPNIALISIEELEGKINQNEYLLVDVRTRDEHEQFNIGGLNIPMTEIENNLHLLSQQPSIVFYCASGKRSLTVAKWLKEKMPEQLILSLNGGLNARVVT